jgi:hypothetical protein
MNNHIQMLLFLMALGLDEYVQHQPDSTAELRLLVLQFLDDHGRQDQMTRRYWLDLFSHSDEARRLLEYVRDWGSQN